MKTYYVNKSVKKCKVDYYQDLVNKNKGNPGELWKSLNQITSLKLTSPPSCIEVNGVPYTEPQSIVEILNDHFSNIGTKLAAKLNRGSFLLCPRSSSVQTTNVKNMFTFQEVNESFVNSQLKQLKRNKAIGLDGISARMLKDSAKGLAPVLQL